MEPERLDCFGTIAWGEAGADHMSRYLFAAQFAKGKCVLDVGTGLGYGAAILKHAGAGSVVAFDIDETTVQKAREKFGASGINYCVANSETFDESLNGFDLIVSFENIEHIPNPREFVRAAHMALNPEGVLLCSTPARECTPEFVNDKPKNPFHLNEWYESEFLGLMQERFQNTEMHSQVETFSLLQRRQAVENLLHLLGHPLRSSTLHNSMRAVSRAASAVGIKSVTSTLRLGADISGLACPSPDDFPIVHRSIRDLFGHLFGHMVVCVK